MLAGCDGCCRLMDACSGLRLIKDGGWLWRASARVTEDESVAKKLMMRGSIVGEGRGGCTGSLTSACAPGEISEEKRKISTRRENGYAASSPNSSLLDLSCSPRSFCEPKKLRFTPHRWRGILWWRMLW